MTCPYCGSETEYDSVDIGVGLQQCGPEGCPVCHAIAMGLEDMNGSTGATPEEIKIGWFRGRQ